MNSRTNRIIYISSRKLSRNQNHHIFPKGKIINNTTIPMSIVAHVCKQTHVFVMFVRFSESINKDRSDKSIYLQLHKQLSKVLDNSLKNESSIIYIMTPLSNSNFHYSLLILSNFFQSEIHEPRFLKITVSEVRVNGLNKSISELYLGTGGNLKYKTGFTTIGKKQH